MTKKITTTLFILFLILMPVTGVSAQSVAKGMSANGATGLNSTPTARIGWEQAKLGIDLGYKYTGASHIPMISVSFLGAAEAGITADIQSGAAGAPVSVDFLFTGKYQFFKSGNAALAGGGNLQFVNGATAGQVYLASTNAGQFFDWPANTTIVIGTTFPDFFNNYPIDFSMGFEMSLWPSVFMDLVHLLVDFANYSYSISPAGTISTARGILNAGIRIDPIKVSGFRFNIDLAGTDLLDASRGFMIGASFGFALL